MSTPLDKFGQLLEQFKPDMYAEAWWQLNKVYKELREEEMGHAKGPWEVDGNINSSAGVISEEGYWIVEPHWVSTETGMANLRLIAAAPDLLQALQRVRLGLIYEHGTRIYEANFGYIEQAITKATAQRDLK